MENTTFAGEALFSADGTAGKFSDTVTFQIGGTAAETLVFDASDKLTDLAAALVSISAAYDTGAGDDEIADAATVNPMIDTIDGVLDSIGEFRAQFGANINRLNHTANNLANM